MYSSPRDKVLSSILENQRDKFFGDVHAGTGKSWSLLLTSITLGHKETALQLKHVIEPEGHGSAEGTTVALD